MARAEAPWHAIDSTWRSLSVSGSTYTGTSESSGDVERSHERRKTMVFDAFHTTSLIWRQSSARSSSSSFGLRCGGPFITPGGNSEITMACTSGFRA